MGIRSVNVHRPLVPTRLGKAATALKLVADPTDVSPLLSRSQLLEALQRVPLHEMKRVVRHRLVPVVWTPDMIFYASCGPQAEAFANHQSLKVVAHLKNADFLWAVRKVWGRKILRNATFGLFNASPEFSARHRILPAQALVMFMGLIAIATSMLQLPVSVTWAAANAIVGLFFLSVVALRLFCIMPGNKIKSPPPLPLGNEQLPLYSVLVPVFRETAVLKQLLQALSKLDYPALCIKRTKAVSREVAGAPVKYLRLDLDRC